MAETVSIEVLYATPEQQRVIALKLPSGANARQAVVESGLLREFPELEPGKLTVGVFGLPCSLERNLRPGDRVEIYRPLQADPKQVRRRAAQRGGGSNSSSGVSS